MIPAHPFGRERKKMLSRKRLADEFVVALGMNFAPTSHHDS
jgi:hypothetical protein